MRRLLQSLTAVVLLCAAPMLLAQKQSDEKPAPLDAVTAGREATQLVAEILSQRPDGTYTNANLLIRGSDRSQRTVEVHLHTKVTETNWTTIYRASSGSNPGSILRIQHSEGSPNVYYSQTGSDTKTDAQKLTASEIMSPFAGSDFWPADLGLEFLHFPTQRLIKKEMYSSRFCSVLESSTADTPAQGYARVRSWFTAEAPHDLLRAEAYDRGGKRIKVFEVSGVEKVNGKWRVESVEMRDVQRNSRTIMQFR